MSNIINQLKMKLNMSTAYSDDFPLVELTKEQAKELLEYIKKQEKVIDKMAEWIQKLMDNTVDKQIIKEIVYKEIENEE